MRLVYKIVVALVLLTCLFFLYLLFMYRFYYTGGNFKVDNENLARNFASIEQVENGRICDDDSRPSSSERDCLWVYDAAVARLKNDGIVFFYKIDPSLGLPNIDSGFSGVGELSDSEDCVSFDTYVYDLNGNFREKKFKALAKVFSISSGIKCESAYDYFEHRDEIIEYGKSLPTIEEVTDEYFEEHSVKIDSKKYLIVRCK